MENNKILTDILNARTWTDRQLQHIYALGPKTIYELHTRITSNDKRGIPNVDMIATLPDDVFEHLWAFMGYINIVFLIQLQALYDTTSPIMQKVWKHTQKLHVESTNVQDFYTMYPNFEHLNDISLGYFSAAESLDTLLHNLQNIRSLQLDNYSAYIPSGVEQLQMWGTDMPDQPCPSLHKLTLVNTTLTSMHGLSHFAPNLYDLSVSGFYGDCAIFTDYMPLVVTLEITQFKLPTLQGIASSFPNLQHLLVNHTSLYSFGSETLLTLESLDISNNAFIDLQGISTFAPNLVSLNARHNFITHLPSDALPRVKEAWLSFNFLLSLDNVSRFIPNVRWLNVRHNAITEIPLTESLPHLTNFYFFINDGELKNIDMLAQFAPALQRLQVGQINYDADDTMQQELAQIRANLDLIYNQPPSGNTDVVPYERYDMPEMSPEEFDADIEFRLEWNDIQTQFDYANKIIRIQSQPVWTMVASTQPSLIQT